MRGEADEALLKKRLEELARRACDTGACLYTEFLSPPEAEWAQITARKQGVPCELDGGWPDAERRIARFGEGDRPFPISAIELTWPHQAAPAHRDILGSVMGLGLKRGCVGDIVLEEERALLFAQQRMASQLMDTLASAGRTRLSLTLMDELPELAPAEGAEVHDTVSSLRLDAVLGGGFGLSRARAAELIASGQAKLNHIQNQNPDARVREGDAISLRGYGRLVLSTVGAPTKKGRIPLCLIRYGARRGQ